MKKPRPLDRSLLQLVQHTPAHARQPIELPLAFISHTIHVYQAQPQQILDRADDDVQEHGTVKVFANGHGRLRAAGLFLQPAQ